MGNGTKGFQRDRVCGSDWRGYFGDHGLHRIICISGKHIMFMKPPLLFIIFGLLATLIPIYNAYKFWFGPERFHQETIDRMEYVPTHPSMRSFALKKIKNKKAWILEGRIVNTIMAIFLLGVDGVLIYAFIFGK